MTTQTFACPNLAGLYRVCKSSKGEMSKLRIMQSMKDGVAVYTIAWSGERHQIHKADGVARETPIFDFGISLVSTAFCEGKAFKRTLVTKLDNGELRDPIEQEYFIDNNILHFRATDAQGVYKDITCKKLSQI